MHEVGLKLNLDRIFCVPQYVNTDISLNNVIDASLSDSVKYMRRKFRQIGVIKDCLGYNLKHHAV